MVNEVVAGPLTRCISAAIRQYHSLRRIRLMAPRLLLVATMVAGLAGFFANRSAATSIGRWPSQCSRPVWWVHWRAGMRRCLRFGGSSIVSGAGLAIGMCFVGLGAWRRSDTNTVRDAEARLSTSTSLFLMLYSSPPRAHLVVLPAWHFVAFSPAGRR